jgi:hypothetical protein
MARYMPTFRPDALKENAGFAAVFSVKEGRKTVSYWFAGRVEELKGSAVFVKFNDGTEDWMELKAEFYNTPEEMEPGRIIWRLYDTVPTWEKEVCFPSTKPVMDAEMQEELGAAAAAAGPSTRRRKAPERDIDQMVAEAVEAAVAAAVGPFSLRLDNFEATLREMRAKMEEGVVTIQKPRMTGIFTHDDMGDYNRLSVAEKSKYYGDGRWQGIIDPFREIKMCASYKLIDGEFACVSKDYDIDEKKYVSNGAAFLSWSWYADEEVIKMTPTNAIGFLKDRSVCKSCAIQCFHGTGRLHAVSERGKLCGICKDKMVNFKRQEGVMPVCTDCMRIMNCEGNRERIVVKALGMIPYRFDGCGITLRIKESNNGRVPDFVMAGTYSNAIVAKGKFFVIIERDQAQHRGYDRADDKSKMVTQVAPFLRAETARVFVIRYSPDGAWKDTDGTNVGADIGEEARLVMMRNWVIWYISSLSTMNIKRLVTLYMFYDLNNLENLFEVGTDSFGMTDKAPSGVMSDHQYSVELGEVDNFIYAKAQRYVAVDRVFKNLVWSQGDRLSKDIRDAIAA